MGWQRAKLPSRRLRAHARPCRTRSLYVPLLFRSQPRSDHQQQVEPENSHEMPVNRYSAKQALAKRAEAAGQPPDQVGKCGNSTEQMQYVHGGKHVKEAAIGVCCEIKSL